MICNGPQSDDAAAYAADETSRKIVPQAQAIRRLTVSAVLDFPWHGHMELPPFSRTRLSNIRQRFKVGWADEAQ